MSYEISVVMPSYNRKEALQKTLTALGEQSAPSGSFEVIVVNDGSTDGTQEMLQGMSSAVRYPLRTLTQKNLGANAARNVALRECQAPWILLLNDDVIPTRGLVEHHLEAHRSAPQAEAAFLGQVRLIPELPFTAIASLHLDNMYRQIEGMDELPWDRFYTCNVSAKVQYILEAGGFEEKLRFHEDVELSMRLRERGLVLRYLPDALGYHDHLLTPSDYLSMARKDGKALAVWYRKEPEVGPELAPLGFVPAKEAGYRLFRVPLRRLFVNFLTEPVLLAMAAGAEKHFFGLSRYLYEVLYERHRYLAIRAELNNPTADSSGHAHGAVT